MSDGSAAETTSPSGLPSPRPVVASGDDFGTHRVVTVAGVDPSAAPAGVLPQAAERLDNDFGRLFRGEVLIAVETLNVDAASFRQIEAEASGIATATVPDDAAPTLSTGERGIAHIVLRTVAARGKQHNPVTGSGGMLLGRVVQVAPGGPDVTVGDRIATLVSLTCTPLRIDRVERVRRESAQIDVVGEAVIFARSPFARLAAGGNLSERASLAALDVAGAAPQVARLVRAGMVVVVLGAAGKSGVLCVTEARRTGGASVFVVGVDASERALRELRELGSCDACVAADARDPIAVRRAVLEATSGRDADVTFSCVNVPDAEMSAILVTRERGVVYFFAMSTSFTKAALGAEAVGKDVDLFIGNGYAAGHAQHTLALVGGVPKLRELFERRYGGAS